MTPLGESGRHWRGRMMTEDGQGWVDRDEADEVIRLLRDAISHVLTRGKVGKRSEERLRAALEDAQGDRMVIDSVTVSVERAAQRLYESEGAPYYGHRSWANQTDAIRERYRAIARQRLEKLAG